MLLFKASARRGDYEVEVFAERDGTNIFKTPRQEHQKIIKYLLGNYSATKKRKSLFGGRGFG